LIVERLRIVSERWPSAFLIAAVLVVFLFFKLVTISGVILGSAIRVPLFLTVLLVTFFSRRYKTESLYLPIKIILKGLVGLFAFYLLFTSLPINRDELTNTQFIESFIYHFLGPVIGVIAYKRFAFALPLVLAVRWQKTLVSEVLSIGITPTDYMPLIEMGILLVLGSLIYFILSEKYALLGTQKENTSDPKPLVLLMLTAVTIHLSNYFWSGMQKILIGEYWNQWLFENPTYYLTLAAMEVGALPLTILGENITNTLINYQIVLNVPLNILIFVLQLGSIVALIKIRWAMLVTAMYDVTHIVIFLVSGIFFYKWIWLNILIVFALNKIKNIELDISSIFWLIIVIILAPVIFYVAFLGWFDTPSFNDEYVLAITEDGNQYRAPSNYFLAGSVTAAQQRLI